MNFLLLSPQSIHHFLKALCILLPNSHYLMFMLILLDWCLCIFIYLSANLFSRILLMVFLKHLNSQQFQTPQLLYQFQITLYLAPEQHRFALNMPSRSGPRQFKPVLFKSQLYFNPWWGIHRCRGQIVIIQYEDFWPALFNGQMYLQIYSYFLNLGFKRFCLFCF